MTTHLHQSVGDTSCWLGVEMALMMMGVAKKPVEHDGLVLDGVVFEGITMSGYISRSIVEGCCNHSIPIFLMSRISCRTKEEIDERSGKNENSTAA